ncbi:DUF2671 domain-containing protein [Rickettsiales bacterium]|nr:DUF2671 domain-containing protein [Rickettsiales bacterium]
MSSLLNLIKKLPNIGMENDNPALDINYIRKSSQLIGEALQKGSDVMQLASGDIVVTEVKTVTYQYVWNIEEKRFERTTNNKRNRRKKPVKGDIESDEAISSLASAE